MDFLRCNNHSFNMGCSMGGHKSKRRKERMKENIVDISKFMEGLGVALIVIGIVAGKPDIHLNMETFPLVITLLGIIVYGLSEKMK